MADMEGANTGTLHCILLPTLPFSGDSSHSLMIQRLGYDSVPIALHLPAISPRSVRYSERITPLSNKHCCIPRSCRWH
jgi:hypothetical protein